MKREIFRDEEKLVEIKTVIEDITKETFKKIETVTSPTK